eukprot:CAMPEP_0170183364 /NCGR_PEP_ID=MMETSP0040_2-20121228/30465_1 /TAXON_ID=641309 /ORGANISM="Lotharella oceanica, Strain CCMP622" /LENGTH=118 /DNA_ID=CAMNT_0010429071 /DNA_START=213 /DNA_END=566 /DNA_ORIENTATION=+
MAKVRITGAGEPDVVGVYEPRDPTKVPAGFAATCQKMFWDPKDTWIQLSDQKRPWFEMDNGSYIYWNKSDGRWWIDGPSGAGVYIAASKDELPPTTGWRALQGSKAPLPTLKIEEIIG